MYELKIVFCGMIYSHSQFDWFTSNIYIPLTFVIFVWYVVSVERLQPLNSFDLVSPGDLARYIKQGSHMGRVEAIFFCINDCVCITLDLLNNT